VSFYGSVYYQLIDTFYKVVLRNRGANKKIFLSDENTPEWLETQAVGRKGVFGFDSGNRWINLNTYSENKPDSNEQFSIYEIYHGAPDAEAKHIHNGFKPHLTDAEIAERTDDNGTIQLEYEDEFESYEAIYDDAGHIAKATKKIYKLPVAEVNTRVERLEGLVGDSANRNLPPLEEEEDQNLYGYVEDNFANVETLKGYVGDWKNCTKYWDWGGKYGPTVLDAIGNLDLMYNDYDDRAKNFKSFSEVIGHVPNLWKTFNKEQFISISDILIEQHEALQDLDASTSGAIAILNSKVGDIGTRPDKYDTVYTELQDLNEAVDNLTATHNTDKTNLETAYKAADSALDTKLTNNINTVNGKAELNANAIKTINDTTIPLINSTIETLRGLVDDHYETCTETEKTLAAKDTELSNSIQTLGTTVSNNYTTLDGKIDTTKSNLEASIKTLSDSVGVVTGGSTVAKMIADGDAAVQANVDGIRTDLGTPDGTSGAFKTIKDHGAAIEKIQKDIGTVGDKALSVQITENLSAINTLNSTVLKSSDAENIYTKKEVLADYAKSSELESYATKTSVEEIGEEVSEISAQLVTLGDSTSFTSEISTDAETLLGDIFIRLKKIEADLAALKGEESTEPENGEGE
jgi:hypothetical protein